MLMMVSKVVPTIILPYLWVYHNIPVHTSQYNSSTSRRSIHISKFTLQPHRCQPRYNSDFNLSQSGLPPLHQPGVWGLKWSGWKVLAANLRPPDVTLRRCWQKTLWVRVIWSNGRIVSMDGCSGSLLEKLHQWNVKAMVQARLVRS